MLVNVLTRMLRGNSCRGLFMLRQPPGLDLSALRGRKISQFFCICSRRWVAFRLFARADGFRILFLIFPFTFLWCIRDPLEDGVYNRSQLLNDTTMTPIMNPIRNLRRFGILL